MKRITLAAAHALLEACSALIIDDDVLIYASLDALSGGAGVDPEPDNEFLRLSWEIEGMEYSCAFAEGPNATVGVEKDSLVLIDTEGEQTRLKLLFPRDIEAAPQPGI